MAYGLSIESQLEVRDSKGHLSFMKMNHPLNTDLGALKQTIPTTAALLDVLIGGAIVGAVFTIPLSVAGWDVQAPLVNSDVEEKAEFVWNTVSGAPTNFAIPTFRESLMDDDGIVNLADSDVDAFVQRIISGRTLGLTNVSPSDAYGSDIDAILSAQEIFLSSR